MIHECFKIVGDRCLFPRVSEALQLFIQDNVRIYGRNWLSVDVARQYSNNSNDDSNCSCRAQGA